MIHNFYFDGSDAGATDPDSAWANDVNAFDGGVGSQADGTPQGSVSSNYLMAEGTNAPSRTDTILEVEARVKGASGGSATLNAAIYTDGLAELLGTATTINGYGSYVTLTAPSGGWTWEKIQALEVKIYITVANFASLYQIEIRVNGPDPVGSIYRMQGFQ